MPCPIVEEPSAKFCSKRYRNASIDQDRYKQFIEKFLGVSDGQASHRVIAVIEELLGKPLTRSSSAIV